MHVIRYALYYTIMIVIDGTCIRVQGMNCGSCTFLLQINIVARSRDRTNVHVHTCMNSNYLASIPL